jgi:hypothetical protein
MQNPGAESELILRISRKSAIHRTAGMARDIARHIPNVIACIGKGFFVLSGVGMNWMKQILDSSSKSESAQSFMHVLEISEDRRFVDVHQND